MCSLYTLFRLLGQGYIVRRNNISVYLTGTKKWVLQSHFINFTFYGFVQIIQNSYGTCSVAYPGRFASVLSKSSLRNALRHSEVRNKSSLFHDKMASSLPSHSAQDGSSKKPCSKKSVLTEAEINSLARRYLIWKNVRNESLTAGGCGSNISVMSYNILAQTNLVNHPNLYHHCNPDFLDWPYRAERILSTILAENCDVVCLQEVQEEHLKTLLGPRMEDSGYRHLYKGKTGGKIEGCAVFWRHEFLDLMRWSAVEMNVPGCRVLNRDNVGLVVLLAVRGQPHTQIVIATTHLLFNPRRGEVKFAQLRLLLAAVEKLAFLGIQEGDSRTALHVPIIICGDLNSTPCSPLYKFLVQGQLGFKGLMHGELAGRCGGQYVRPEEINVGGLLPCSMLEEDYIERYGLEALSAMDEAFSQCIVYHLLGPFGSCYTHKKRDAHEVTTFNDTAVTVDYIFFQKTHYLSHVATRSIMTKSEIESLGGLPNAAMGSDHLPLIARFVLRSLPKDVLKTGL